MKGIGYKDSDVVILSPSPILSRFVTESVSRCNMSVVTFCNHNVIAHVPRNPRVVFVDFCRGVSVAAIARTFPTARIAVLAGASGASDLERQSDLYPFFDFIEKPFSAADIRSVLPTSFGET